MANSFGLRLTLGGVVARLNIHAPLDISALTDERKTRRQTI